MPEELTLDDLRAAVDYLNTVAGIKRDFYVVLTPEYIPDIVRAYIRWFMEHAYYSENIEHVADTKSSS